MALLPDLGGYFGPNYDGVIPSSKRTGLVSNADISYRMTAHTAIGITGGYQQFDYDSIDTSQLPAASLVDSRSLTDPIYVSDQISRRQTLGVQLAYTDIYSYSTQESRVQAPAVLLFDTVKLTQHSMLTVFAGPEYSRSSTVVPITILGIPSRNPLATRLAPFGRSDLCLVGNARRSHSPVLAPHQHRRRTDECQYHDVWQRRFPFAAYQALDCGSTVERRQSGRDRSDQSEHVFPDALGRRQPDARGQPEFLDPSGRRLRTPNRARNRLYAGRSRTCPDHGQIFIS